MKTVWKWANPLSELGEVFTFDVPKGGEILSVANQEESLAIWALVDPRAKRELRHVLVIGTGFPVPGESCGRFLGTVLFAKGKLVLHIFEGK